MWDKAYLLALILLGSNFVLGAITVAIGELLKFESGAGMGVMINFITAFTIGRSYAENKGVVTPVPFRIWISIYHALLYVCLVTLFLFATQRIKTISEFLPFLPVALFVNFVVTYLGLSFGGRDYVKRSKK
jgi:hypothetical protein